MMIWQVAEPERSAIIASHAESRAERLQQEVYALEEALWKAGEEIESWKQDFIELMRHKDREITAAIAALKSLRPDSHNWNVCHCVPCKASRQEEL